MYKILVLKNETLNLTSSYEKVKEYFTKKGINISFTFKDIIIPINSNYLTQYKLVQGFNSITGAPTPVKIYGLGDSLRPLIQPFTKDGEYQAVIFSYNMDSVPVPGDSAVTSFCFGIPLFSNTEYMQLSLNQYFIDQDRAWKAIAHEIIHSFCYYLNRRGHVVLDEMDMTKMPNGAIIPAYKNDDPYAVDGNFAQTLDNIKPYISKLYPVVGYKYFSKEEVAKWKLKPEMWTLLDKIRGECGFAFNINSGLRTKEENDALKDSVSDSAHLSGLAVDIACTESAKRFKMIEVALKNGIKRIGVGKTFVHLDIDETKPQSVVWHYY